MAKFNLEECPVCGENSFSLFLTCTDFFVSGEKFNIKNCNTCGFKITENIEDENNIDRYYQSEEYISHSNTSNGVINLIYHKVRNYMLGQKRKLVELAVGMQSGKILDIGAGTGFFLNEMRLNGWQVTGTEKSADARKFAQTEFNLAVNETEDLFQFENSMFDVITLWHVLEHIHRLSENMEAIVRLLKDDGKLVIAVPNHESYDAQHYEEFWAAYDVPRHIWHFAPSQMKSFGERYGLKLEKIKTMPFDSFYVSLLSEKYKKSTLKLVGGIFHGMISWLQSLVSPKVCSSVIYIFSK